MYLVSLIIRKDVKCDTMKPFEDVNEYKFALSEAKKDATAQLRLVTAKEIAVQKVVERLVKVEEELAELENSHRTSRDLIDLVNEVWLSSL